MSDGLLLAVKTGDPTRVKELLQDNHNVNYTDSSGTTLLHHAVVAGDAKMVDILLKGGADRALKDGSSASASAAATATTGTGKTALELAVDNKAWDCVAKFAKIPVATNRDAVKFGYVYAVNKVYWAKYEKSEKAADAVPGDLVPNLIEAGTPADLTLDVAWSSHFTTPSGKKTISTDKLLHLLVITSSGRAQILPELLKQKTKIKGLLELKDKHSKTPLQIIEAMQTDCEQSFSVVKVVLEMLLQAGAKPDNEWLLKLAEAGEWQQVQFIIENTQADKREPALYKRLLHIAVRYYCPESAEAIKFLLSEEVGAKQTDNANGRSGQRYRVFPIWQAAQDKHRDCVEALAVEHADDNSALAEIHGLSMLTVLREDGDDTVAKIRLAQRLLDSNAALNVVRNKHERVVHDSTNYHKNALHYVVDLWQEEARAEHGGAAAADATAADAAVGVVQANQPQINAALREFAVALISKSKLLAQFKDNIAIDGRDGEIGHTPLRQAFAQNKPGAVVLLLQCDAVPDFTYLSQYAAVDRWDCLGVFWNNKGARAQYPEERELIEIAIKKGDEASLNFASFALGKWVAEAQDDGAGERDRIAIDKQLGELLFTAIGKNNSEMVSELCQAGMAVYQNTEQTGRASAAAAAASAADAADDTGRRGVKKFATRNDMTPIVMAASQGKWGCVAALLEDKLPPSASDAEGYLHALMYAVKAGENDLVSQLAALINTHTGLLNQTRNFPDFGFPVTALDIATHDKNHELMRVLLTAGINPNRAVSDGQETPLQQAFENRDPEAIGILLVGKAASDFGALYECASHRSNNENKWACVEAFREHVPLNQRPLPDQWPLPVLRKVTLIMLFSEINKETDIDVEPFIEKYLQELLARRQTIHIDAAVRQAIADSLGEATTDRDERLAALLRRLEAVEAGIAEKPAAGAADAVSSADAVERSVTDVLRKDLSALRENSSELKASLEEQARESGAGASAVDTSAGVAAAGPADSDAASTVPADGRAATATVVAPTHAWPQAAIQHYQQAALPSLGLAGALSMLTSVDTGYATFVLTAVIGTGLWGQQYTQDNPTAVPQMQQQLQQGANHCIARLNSFWKQPSTAPIAATPDATASAHAASMASAPD